MVNDFQESKKRRDKSTRKNLEQRRVQNASDLLGFLRREDEGRCQEDVVAVEAIHAALRRVREHVLVERSLADTFGHVLFFWKRFSGGFVFDEFNAQKETETADFAYIRMRFQVGEFRAETFAGWFHAFQ